MARHFPPVAIPKNIDRWLYDALTRLNTSSQESSAGLAAINRGDSPDGSGGPLVDLSQYFYLPGRQGGQQAYGATEGSGFLQLSSTKSTTKGNIYLGSARSSLIDELNDRLGMGTTSPQARVHAVGVGAGVLVAASDISNVGWGLYNDLGAAPATVTAAITSPNDNEAGFIGRNGNNNGSNGDAVVALNGTVGNGTSFTVRFWARRSDLIPTGTLLFGVRNSLGVEYNSSTNFDPIASLTLTWTQYTVTCNIIGATGLTPDTLRVQAGFQSGTALAGYIEVSEVELVTSTLTSAIPLIAQGGVGQATNLFEAQNSTPTVLAGFTSGGNLFVGTTAGLTSTELYAKSRAATDIVAILRGFTSQSGDLLEWQSVTPVVLGGINAAGNIFIGDTAGVTGTELYAKARAAADVIAILRGTTSQSGDALRIQDVTPTTKIALRALASETGLDLTVPAAGKAVIRFIPTGTQQAYLDFGATTDFGPALGVAGAVPCPGTRLSTYLGGGAQLTDGYGQDGTDAWVLIDPATTYTLWTGDTTSASRKRAQWQPNGDLENFGVIISRKFTVGTTGLAAGVPGVSLETTGAGTNVIAVRAPATVAASRVQLLFDLNGTIPLVGNKAIPVTSKTLGKVDSTGLSAAVASTNLTSSGTVGMYRVIYELADTTLDATSIGITVQFQINYTDDAGAKTQTSATVLATAVSSVQGSFDLYLASGELSYQTNVSGALGAARYALRVRVVFLG